ncbi:FAD-binding protein [Pigmentiphaga litoralis]|uniref:Flavin-dependent dehydrogenase n=1 Tax=Pigmentiphaga litoralis TaxID=516702 RepID=A0A7Y9LP75_9BURK|nr:flavin-dependent dehydrogenase [Pigmentiphaga litoralis]NYE84118.1 flavin-dependent dehydrogenase [Pigmentiphaga litoralis]
MPSDPRVLDLDVIVIGAGLADLSCAVRLTDRGLRVGIDRLAERAGRTVFGSGLDSRVRANDRP